MTLAFRSSWREESRARIGSWLDQLAVRGMSRAFDATLMPTTLERGALRASAAPYLGADLGTAPGGFFAFFDAPASVAEMRLTGRRPIDGGTIASYELASAYVPFDGEVPPCASNDWMPLEHWTHGRPDAPTVVAVHGFTMGDPAAGAAALMAPDWFRLGFDVVLVTLPFHGRRTPPDARFSGELFASWHVGRLSEAVRQSIHDLRATLVWLRAQGQTQVGLIGLSLGGYLAALMAAFDPALAFVIPIAAPVRLGTFPSTLFAHSPHARRTVAPFTPEELDAAYRVHCPLTYPLAIPAERALIVAGRGDRIVPPEHAVALAEHWRCSPIHWFGGSHVTPFRRAAVFAAGARHVRGLGIGTTRICPQCKGEAHEPSR
jgi:pimeloyl-ACP methyl ester carboxylesterase